MPNTRQILKRRRTAQNIRKITRTMEMVATVRFRRVSDPAVQRQAYADQLARLVYALSNATEAEGHHPLLARHDEAPRDAMLLLTSNRGLCGGYNAAILRLAMQRLEELQDENRTVDLYAVGRKAIANLRFRGVPVHTSREQFEGLPDFEEVARLADAFIDRFVKGELRRVEVAFTQFVSAGAQRAVRMTLLPLERPDFSILESEGVQQQVVRMGLPAMYDFEPDLDTVLGELLPHAVRNRLYQCFLDAIASEQVARMTAMRLASESAEEMIRQLTAQYNRARQALITTELSEIMGGAEALKDS